MASGSVSANWRLDAAASIANCSRGSPGLNAMMVGGSVGRGHPDRWSDLEMAVFWRHLPPDDVLLDLAKRAGGRDRRSWAYDPAEYAVAEEYWLGGLAGPGLLVELQHQSLADGAALLDDLLDGINPEPYFLTYASALNRGEVLFGAAELQPLRTRVAAYPHHLAVAAATKHGQIDKFWRWQMLAERGELLALRGHYAETAERLSHLLFAVNRRWWPGRKWMLRELANLQHLPAGTVDGLRRAGHAPAADAAAILSELIEEAYDLAERLLPGLDVTRLRQIFRFQRKPLNEMPS
ncbi:MAG: DUF4037 domain-containing protein [Nocardiopsaceae bacterium]|jgi:hypothetical protein|nr:DUF4037 domain-containing protein [Nocardiopsaceae bacterium]